MFLEGLIKTLLCERDPGFRMRLPQHEAEMRSVEVTVFVFVITGTVRPPPIEVHFKRNLHFLFKI
jgi:hypothetical protein